MAKKYLLYIHDERFANEPKKSELVNALLTAHYGESVVAMPIPEPKIVRKVASFIKPSEPTTKMVYCKNGHIIPSGRDKCTFKGCKYS